jgi:peptidoglycan/LPS O-acetylase OafA/YrhL
VPIERRTEIQWLRALAALEVVVVHSDLLTKHFSNYHIVASALYRPLGGIGVELFFIVSGYVICMNAPSYRTGWQFLRSRALRLYPMYWVFTTLVLLTFAVNPEWHLSNFELTTSSLINSYLILPQSGFPILGVGWTLEREMMFYTFVGIFMILAAGAADKMLVAWFLAAMGLVGCIIGPGPGTGASVWLYHIFNPYMFAFGFGWLLRCGEENAASRRFYYIAVFAGVGMLAYWISSQWGERLTFRIGVASVIFLAFIVCRRRFEADSRLNRLAWTLGDASYTIYLSHWFVLSGLGKMLGVLDPPAMADGFVRVAGVLLCAAVGVAIYTVMERPIDRWLRKRPSPRDAAPFPISGMATSHSLRR